ncbi:hypothetical protein SODALDRAFT_309943 [Sodiomyces alkalinus F11]|uniref:RING-type E3 ubiquitin transferase n=1 Tax=Sodiomyces alkalinus (strain CBS 110278 / VKM F-3762 / F11) TaxID=1314773 RepID=A0A3N2Q055_SODAK|nr:hypothetical protein SODALDRAFT_309943 [Sodiomyces alkalinus F11]ROT40137.1 hypothetical protein SODALDRAFT_309943 [Sodiomyces alkalinus F11]
MRLAWYATISTALAASVVFSAFQQRANCYSAMVYLAQSNVCLLVLINFVYLIYGTVIFGLQRSLYGPLRQVEVEQLSEKAWFAITETCLAMTIFRDEIGAWFLVMFTALITGKVWGWIGDGRVEILEQQPPANPGLFHTRLSISLLLSLAYDIWILRYSMKTVIQQARPDMMVMFLFEFAVLSTSSARTGIRYLVSVMEHGIIKRQTRQRLEERRLEVRQRREELLRQREQQPRGGSTPDHAELPQEEDIDEMDIEVPGWENKGQWVLILDLVADCTKLSIYIVFFFILFSFYGLPIHIMRDLFMTGRGVIKRVTALWKYRKAIEEMNKYADATEADITREDTCIICREQMRPWDPGQNPPALQRVRPKKLPCGHILHMGCLKSWLERQQVCPTCRRSVVLTRTENMALRNAGPDQPGAVGPLAPGQQELPQRGPGGQQGRDVEARRPNGGARVFNLGNLRVGFAQGGENIQELAQRMAQPRLAITPPEARLDPTTAVATDRQTAQGSSGSDLESIRDHLMEIERTIQRQLQTLQYDHRQLQVCNLLLAELQRLHQQRQHDTQAGGVGGPAALHTPFPLQTSLPPLMSLPNASLQSGPSPNTTRHGLATNSNAILAGSPELPEGVVIPPGWSLLPLQRLEGVQVPVTQFHPNTVFSVGNGQPTSSNTVNPRFPASAPLTTAEPMTASDRLTRDFPPNELDPSRVEHRDEGHQPEILSPNPVLPNWGGENQLFGRGSVLAHDAGSGTPVREPTDLNWGATDETRAAGPSLMSPAHDDVVTNEPRDQAEQPTPEGTGKGKAKAKAVTIEDAEDEDGN